MTKKKESFEDQMSKLNEIIEQMEKGDMPLEAMLAEYEKGVAMIKTLTATLDAAEASVSVLSNGKTEEINGDI